MLVHIIWLWSFNKGDPHCVPTQQCKVVFAICFHSSCSVLYCHASEEWPLWHLSSFRKLYWELTKHTDSKTDKIFSQGFQLPSCSMKLCWLKAALKYQAYTLPCGVADTPTTCPIGWLWNLSLPINNPEVLPYAPIGPVGFIHMNIHELPVGQWCCKLTTLVHVKVVIVNQGYDE